MAKFSDKTKGQVFLRQHGNCAQCGYPLNELLEETEMESINFHHVVPEKMGGSNDEENCVALCSYSHSKSKDGCHYHAHQRGYFRGLVTAPPEHFEYSHGHDEARHKEWVRGLRKIHGEKIWPLP